MGSTLFSSGNTLLGSIPYISGKTSVRNFLYSFMAVLTFWHNRIGGFEKKVAVNVLLVMQPSEKKESETETLRQLDTVKKEVKTVIMIFTCPATRPV